MRRVQKSCRFLPLLILLGVVGVGLSKKGQEQGEGMKQKVKTWHAVEEAKKPAKLRVVYFHGNDMKPLEAYQKRLTRVMDDVSDFYRDGMLDWGFESDGIPLEKDEAGQLVLHTVKAKHPAKHYDYSSGNEAKKEIREALADVFDLEREFVLVLYGQCWEIGDGRMGFFSPYYGDTRSCQKWGFCHAADCRLLDPKNLKDTKTRFKYWEHYGDRDQSVAKFNSFYLGGIAHELGHGLGLPHDCESPLERRIKGRSLMGNGNLTYREEVWNPRSKGSFLSRASAVRLLSHPLFTNSNRGRFEDDGLTVAVTKLEAVGKVMKISGRVAGEVPAYAAMAYVDPEGGGDYDARTYLAEIEDGRFVIEGLEIPTKPTEIRVFACFSNGAVARVSTKVIQAGGKIDVEKMKSDLRFGPIRAAEAAILNGWKGAKDRVNDAVLLSQGDEVLESYTEVLVDMIKPEAKPIDLGKTKLKEVFLSDAKWASAESGWAGTPRNRWGAEAGFGQGLFLTIAGKLHRKGLPAHTPATHVFETGKKWKRMQATVGLRDGANTAAKVVFIVKGDGKELARTKPLSTGQVEEIDLEVKNVKRLELVTESATQSDHGSWAVWGSPKVTK